MIQKIKNHLLLITSALMLTVQLAAPAAMAAPPVCTGGGNTIGDNVSAGANGAATNNPTSDCTQGTGVDNNSVSKVANQVVNVFSLVVGAIAVIMIIVGGFRYITSGGSSDKIGSAKNTLIYAIVGLIIVALAQIIVHFVLNRANQAVS